MGSLSQHDEGESETLQRGCFPTSSKRSIKANQSVCSAVLGHDALEALNLSRFGGIERIANVSWAILLRAYLRTNRVSFSFLQDERPEIAKDIHYCLLDHVRLDEVRQVDTRELGNIGEGPIDINTAIRQTKTSLPVNDEQIEAQQLQARDMRQVCLFSAYRLLFCP
jgi:hypothetical protein